jgi:hypothetical protein
MRRPRRGIASPCRKVGGSQARAPRGMPCQNVSRMTMGLGPACALRAATILLVRVATLAVAGALRRRVAVPADPCPVPSHHSATARQRAGLRHDGPAPVRGDAGRHLGPGRGGPRRNPCGRAGGGPRRAPSVRRWGAAAAVASSQGPTRRTSQPDRPPRRTRSASGARAKRDTPQERTKRALDLPSSCSAQPGHGHADGARSNRGMGARHRARNRVPRRNGGRRRAIWAIDCAPPKVRVEPERPSGTVPPQNLATQPAAAPGRRSDHVCQ